MTLAPRFLSVDDVLALHSIAIEDQGGDPSIREIGLLESAVAMPRQQVGGQFVHDDIPAMAAAYAFHVCKNHPFVDGNKRAGAAAMIAFLSDNGWSFDATADDAEPVILSLAAGALDKESFTAWARSQMHQKPSMELREFFMRAKPADVDLMVESVIVSDSGAEAKATIEDAARAIPYIGFLVELLPHADEQEHAQFSSVIVLLTALYRIAEDMGYEW